MKTDREQIQELAARYARAIDSRNYAAIEACFTKDACADYTGFSGKLEDRSQIMRHMRKALGPLDRTQHFCTNFIIDIDGTKAKLEFNMLAQHVVNGPDGRVSFLGGGVYNVELVNDGGEWKFRSVTAESQWGDGDRALLPDVD